CLGRHAGGLAALGEVGGERGLALDPVGLLGAGPLAGGVVAAGLAGGVGGVVVGRDEVGEGDLGGVAVDVEDVAAELDAAAGAAGPDGEALLGRRERFGAALGGGEVGGVGAEAGGP